MWQIIVLIILLVLSGFFSMSETALMALSKIRIRHMVEEGVKGAKLVEKLTEDPNKLLGAIINRQQYSQYFSIIISYNIICFFSRTKWG